MPLKRTPPKNSVEESVSHYTSEPNLASPPVSDMLSSDDRITFRNKRRHDTEFTEEIRSLREDFTSILKDLKHEQNYKFQQIQKNFDDIKKQNADLRTDIQFISDKYDELLNRISKIEVERKNSNTYIKNLESKIENMERSMRSSCVEIRNLPKKNPETKEDLVNLVKNIGTTVRTNIAITDIKDVFRPNYKSLETRPPVIVEFSNTFIKEKLTAGIKSFNRSGKEKLNASHINLEGKSPIYVSESLTTKSKQLFHKAREFSKLNGFSYCWTSHGRIYIRKKEGDRAMKIDDECDIVKINSDM